MCGIMYGYKFSEIYFSIQNSNPEAHFFSFIFSSVSSETSPYTQKQKLYKIIYKKIYIIAKKYFLCDIIYIRVKLKSHAPGRNSWQLEAIANPKTTKLRNYETMKLRKPRPGKTPC